MDYYTVSQSCKVQEAEKDLNKEIIELQNEIENISFQENGSSKSLTSITAPPSPDYFKIEREVTINKLIHQKDGNGIKNLSNVFNEELLVSKSSEITAESLPFLLLQFYLDRMSWLVQCKHLHMLRWRRFSHHSEAVERLFPSYISRLNLINKEYLNAKETSRRLSIVHVHHMLGKTSTSTIIRAEDIKTFFRWLVCHTQSIKKICTYINSLQWISLKYKDRFLGVEKQTNESKESKNENEPLHNKPFQFLPETPILNYERSFSTTSSLLSDKVTCNQPPLYNLHIDSFRKYLQELISEYEIPFNSTLSTQADEMDLFGAVNRRFKALYKHQQKCYTFYQCDNSPKEYENWGLDNSSCSLLKPSTWLKYIQIFPCNNPNQLKKITYLKQHGNVDELLVSQNNFLLEKDFKVVIESLKLHSQALKDQPKAEAISVTSNLSGTKRSSNVWDRIYKASLKKREDEIEDSNLPSNSNSAISRSSNDDYDYVSTMQMFGLDEGEDITSQDQVIIQGAYLSYIHLRHLKIRDLKREVLQLLNYFRSVERTITIFNCGMSLERSEQDETSLSTSRSKRNKSASNKNKETTTPSGRSKTSSRNKTRSRTQGLNIGNHHHIHNNPADFKIEEDRFMEFAAVENHDDFYSLPTSNMDLNNFQSEESSASLITSSSRVNDDVPYVQDQCGHYIVYDAAVKDVEDLEEQLILIASYYIGKAPVGNTSGFPKVNFKVDLSADGKRNVDRFEVLFQIWKCELKFNTGKRKLLDCFLEAYHNTFCPIERRKLTQIITNIIYQRPRYDFTSDYFIELYEKECICLHQKINLFTEILVNHMTEEKNFLNKTCSSNKSGLPFYYNMKQEISPNLPIPSLKHVDIFEFHPNLGSVASRSYEALDYTINNVIQMFGGNDISSVKICEFEKVVVQAACEEWQNLSKVSTTFNSDLQKNIFSSVIIEDPNLFSDLIESMNKNENTKSSAAASQKVMKVEVTRWINAVELVLLRHRLLQAAFETENLNKSIYKSMAVEMGFGEFHSSLRILAFEFAKKKEVDNLSSDSCYIDERKLDRFNPESLCLAINEVDEVHLSKFSFKTRQAIIQILEDKSILETIRISLSCQVTTKNCFSTALNQIYHTNRWKLLNVLSDQQNKEKSSNNSLNLTGNNENSNKNSTKQSLKKNPVFISVQEVKRIPRDMMTNSFINKKESGGMTLRQPGQLESLKKTLISEFCDCVTFRVGIHAVRGQIIACYASLLHLLQSSPETLNSFFILGEEFEEKGPRDCSEGLKVHPEKIRKRPRKVISDSGDEFINIWFIPHFTEILSLHRHLNFENQQLVLNNWLAIISSFHQIIQFIFARSTLGDSKMPFKKPSFAGWGGMQGIHNELKEIQSQIDSLSSVEGQLSKNPTDVAELLVLRRRVLFKEFDVVISGTLSEMLLAAGDEAGHQILKQNSQHVLDYLDGCYGESFDLIGIKLPQTLFPKDRKSKQLFPWLCYQSVHGVYPTSYQQHWQDVGSLLHRALSGLNDNQLQRANGELLGLTLMLDEVLQQGFQPVTELQDFLNKSHPNNLEKSEEQYAQIFQKDESTKFSDQIECVTKTNNPLMAHKIILKFLHLTKQLNSAKHDWSTNKLQVTQIDSQQLYRTFTKCFQNEIVYPVYCSIARLMGNGDQYDFVSSDEETLPLPHQASIIKITSNLLFRLLEFLELKLISDLRLRINKDLTMLLTERSRSDETVLPLDVWQQQHPTLQSRDDNLSVSSPQLFQDFVQRLHSDAIRSQDEEGNQIISFNEDHLKLCLLKLASDVTIREKDNYESYSSFYNNLLLHHHQLLYKKELQLKWDRIQSYKSSHFEQFQLADQSHELILEVTALRSKVLHLKDQMKSLEDSVREDERERCRDLIKDLFKTCFHLKSKLAEYHLGVHQDMKEMLKDTRMTALTSLQRLRDEEPTSTAEERLKTINEKEKQLAKLRAEQYEMNLIFQKFKTLNHMKRITTEIRSREHFNKLHKSIALTKEECIRRDFVAREENDTLREELASVRRVLEESQHQLEITYEKISRENKLAEEKNYMEQLQKQNRQHLQNVQQRKVDRLLMELHEKDVRLRSLTSDVENTTLINNIQRVRVQRNLQDVESKLIKEKSLKLDAYERIDDLQSSMVLAEKQIQEERRTSTASIIRRPKSSAARLFKTSVKTRPISVYNSKVTLLPAPLPKKRPHTAGIGLRDRIASSILFTETAPINPKVITFNKN